MRKPALIVLLVLLAVTSVSAIASQPRYEVVPCNLPDYSSVTSYSDGALTGYCWPGTGNISHPFITESGAFSSLSEYNGEATGICPEINMACGWVDDGNTMLPVVWNNKNISYLSALRGQARGLNRLGSVVGALRVSGTSEADAVYHPFAWIDGDEIDLGNFGGRSSMAEAINDSNQVVGSSAVENGYLHAFLWEDGEMTDLGLLPDLYNFEALDINNQCQIIGTARGPMGPDEKWHGFIWEKGKLREIEMKKAYETIPFAINNNGVVVGSYRNSGQDYYAFKWSNNRAIDLNNLVALESGWHLARAIGIDNDGIICAILQQEGWPYDWKVVLLEPIR